MKVLSVEQIREADKYTIENEPIESIDLMERAARKAFEWLYRRTPREKTIKIFCGMGNNGGDGLAVARMLNEQEMVPQVFMVRHSDRMSHDCEVNYYRLVNETKVPMFDILGEDDFPNVGPDDVVVDAIFGSGLNRPPQGMTADLIAYLNQSRAIRVAIDVPSGLFADQPSALGFIFKADYTLSFQFPKLAFLFPENDPYVGRFEILDIGLHPRYVEEVETRNLLTVKAMVKPILHSRTKYSHKGTYGHALLIAGSEGKTGAALLGAKACLRTGVGLLSVHLPKMAQLPLQTAIPEAMVDGDESETCFTMFKDLDAYSAVGVGPGLGKADETQRALKRLIQEVQVPLVMDADALNILSENPTWLAFLPAKTILTPHPKEFERLVGKTTTSFERLERQRELSMKHNIIIVLKGAHTSITMPNGTCFFNTTGNPGMATAGSGDVLTGIILSLLAQRYSPEEAAVLGVYLHGLAGDLAAEEIGQEALIAGDIVEHLGKAFFSLRSK
ncbi:MAG: NAD(P)H-hydrate dehydratase [Bacteroidales bacterium]|nr:NAD(P)H-hydrate dehydratase [Bacteroidales bacterium]